MSTIGTVILRPVADGATLQLTPTPTGSHYACIDEATTDDADYLKTPSTSSVIDLLTLGTCTLPGGAIITKVKVTARYKDPTPASSSMSLYFWVGGANQVIKTSIAATNAWVDHEVTMRQSIMTGTAWTAAELSGITFKLWMYSPAGTGMVSQLYLTVTYVVPDAGLSTLTLRPSADKAASGLSQYPASPTTRYDKIDEETEDTADYVYIGGVDGFGTFELPDTAIVGAISHVAVKAKVKWSDTGTSDLVGLALNESTAANVVEGVHNSTAEFESVAYFEANPTDDTAWEPADIAALFVGIRMNGGTGSGKCYQLWVEVYYKPTIYCDAIICASAGNGYTTVSGVLRSDCPTPAYKQAQLAAVADFGTILADSTELAAVETPGDPIAILFAWTPSSAGTYYARLGIRASGEATLTWVTVKVTINFPAVTGITVAQAGEHATVTVTVTDDYADPPEVTLFIDGQAVKGRLN